jgi:cephalosporin hydroxylase
MPDASLPPPVRVDLHEPVRAYWRRRIEQHTDDSYAGVPTSKFPEDLRVYEHLIWSTRADVVIEIGVQFGGSALWFRDRLQAAARYGRIAAPLVIGVDVDTAPARKALEKADPAYADSITLVEGDVGDPDTPRRVGAILPPGARCLVVEDSAHTYEATISALRGFSDFVAVGGMFVVEDGCVDVEELRLRPDWPRGVLPAIDDWLASEQGRAFERCRDLELYGVSCHPGGYLRRRTPA